ncbi:MAG: murein DD-endopeptidase MepM/ murein hydrolase activator NlpD [Motiliproteus sp.]|jgi:murein DD-endopeptidase MepM/ murein hydrolase activator NlpD
MRPILHPLALALLLLTSLSGRALAATAPLPDSLSVPGGIAHVLLPIDSATAPAAYLGKQRLLVRSTQGTQYQQQAPWLALVGISLNTATGSQQINVGNQVFEFEVTGKAYREQRLVIKNKRKVNPNKLDMDRIITEKTRMLGALASWSEPKTTITRFQLPASGPFSSPFGLRRFFNDQPRKPHSGLDIAAAKDSPILAPAPGVILDAGDYFFNGRNLILDHGRGLISMYSHMERIDVSVGDQINTGDLLGTVGSSGRVTGPHLHWSVSLNNVRVDPTLFLDPSER